MSSLKVFLSHRYESPDTNLFFFQLFCERAILHFEVDAGVTYKPVGGGEIIKRLPTNVTRLERMLRAADAFVGIYPLPGPPGASWEREALLNESRYFRLELDLAMRSGKPALVCFDQRYKTFLGCPTDFFVCPFDAQEIASGKDSPSTAGFQKTFADFCQHVEAWMAYRASRGAPGMRTKVGVLLPPAGASQVQGYGDEHRQVVMEALASAEYDAVLLPWPPVLDRKLLVMAAALNWVVVDVGDHPDAAAAIGYFHGQFVPALRLKRTTPETDQKSALERNLYGGVEVGYLKDIIRWGTMNELEAGICSRIQVIDLPARRISSRAQAEEYFREAALRKENVFLSYSGKDEAVAARISAALKKRFQKVFDYKDGESIRPGQPWLKEIFGQLSTAAIAIPLLSESYMASGNCEHEAREIVAHRDSGKLRMIPVRLYPGHLPVPSWLTDVQHEKAFAEDANVEALVERIVGLVKQEA